ncbi:hypothetical protein [Thioalkalivibrio nitratireducens]|uniref:hypothetical protein n=1 Tax=Thioalkalivibrio nitratireducens TaxID=186931 RepID=UPI0005C1B44E|nr:hypothetical protein [Thioalkalivibrio nitratireducens]
MDLQSLLHRQIRMERSQIWILSLLFIVVLIGADLRYQSVVHTEVVAPAIRADARDYVLYAWNFKHFGVYSRSATGIAAREAGAPSVVPPPDAVRTPGYPLFLVSVQPPLEKAAMT